jgi:transcriptional regulator with GAF, ATPase, and Fis domain
LVNGRPTQTAPLADGDLIELGQTFFLFRESLATWPTSPNFVDTSGLRPTAPGLVTLVPPFAEELKRVEAIAPSSVSVVIRGETGTGKEVAASAIHQLSGRRGPFVAVNCAALTKTLVESELFGYRRGAFSGATEDRPGLIRSADRGTLFLDEIGDLPFPAQSVLLRVLQEGEILPIGGTQAVRVDIRLLVATHRDLEALVAENQFRADLLARVSGLTLSLPALRERREDLGILIGSLIRRHAPVRADQVKFSCDAARALLRYQWPLNIRELEKCLMAAMVLARSTPIQLSHFPTSVQASLARPDLGLPTQQKSPARMEPPASLRLSEADRKRREEIVGLLEKHGGNITAVALALGKPRSQVQRWIKRYRIDSSSFRP